jgi:hypothetical protein
MVQVLSEHGQYQRLSYTSKALIGNTEGRIPSRMRGRIPGTRKPQASLAEFAQDYGRS